MQLIDPSHPFYAPAWRRYAIVAFLVAWVLYEVFVSRDGFWMVIAAGMLGLAVWTFIVSWRDAPAKGDEPPNI